MHKDGWPLGRGDDHGPADAQQASCRLAKVTRDMSERRAMEKAGKPGPVPRSPNPVLRAGEGAGALRQSGPRRRSPATRLRKPSRLCGSGGSGATPLPPPPWRKLTVLFR